MATKYIQLPSELWLRIMEQNLTQSASGSGGEPHAWLKLRQVNTVFRTSVETIFREAILPKTFIRYDLGKKFHYTAMHDKRLKGQRRGNP